MGLIHVNSLPQAKGGRTRGKQVYLGGWETEVEAAEAYDKAAIKYWGQEASLNASASSHDKLKAITAYISEDTKLR